MIPKLVDVNGVWKVLPPGIHDATLQEIEQHFAFNGKRKQLFEHFKKGLECLRKAGCRAVFINGSFISDKPIPGDFDACWDPTGVDSRKLDPVLLDFSQMRARQKAKYRGEFFPSSARADGSRVFLQFFQTDKNSGQPKGIIRIQLS